MFHPLKLSGRSYPQGQRWLCTATTSLDASRSFLKHVATETSNPGHVSLDMSEDPRIAILTLKNARRHNALTPSMMLQLEHIICHQLTSSAANPLVAVVVVGEGTSFCAGLDLNTARAHLSTAQAGLYMSTFMQHLLNRLLALPLVSVAALQGHALGGGAELSTACDFRLMQSHARVQFVQARMGVTPGWAGGSRLVQLVGRQHALRLLMNSRPLTAELALSIGFCDGVVPVSNEPQEGQTSTSSNVVPFALKWLKQEVLGDLSLEEGAVLREMKRLVHAAAWNDQHMQQSVKMERLLFSNLWGGPLNQRALRRK